MPKVVIPKTDEEKLDVSERKDSPVNKDDFKKRLEKMLAAGPKGPAKTKPTGNSNNKGLDDNEIIDSARMEVPKNKKDKKRTTRYDASKYDF